MIKLQKIKDELYFQIKTIHYFDIGFWLNWMKLAELKNKYSGNRCFIMGNGPSLNKTPLNKLDGEYVWGLNRCYLLFDKIKWRPTFYTAVDDLVVPNISEEINAIVQKYHETVFFFPQDFLYQKVLKKNKNIIWFKQRAMDPCQNACGYFSKNPFWYVRTPNTVSITALQLAVYMGFNPIILIGCDTEYTIPPDTIRRGKAIDPGTGNIIEGFCITSKTDNDPNHFTEHYFGTGSNWHFPNVEGMLFGYKCAQNICDSLNIQVLNATVGGKLDIFPRVPFNDLF